VPGKKCTYNEQIPGECCVDPCTGRVCHKPATCRKVVCQGPPQQCTRQVWKTRTVCEQVPCTTYVKRTICEKVPYTVTKKVPYTVVKKVPYETCRRVCGAYVDAQGNTYECAGEGRTFKEGAQVCKQIPYTVKRMVTEVCKKQIPYTVAKCVTGAYLDEKGVGHDCEGPGRSFQEGAQICRDVCTTSCRMVQEQCVKQVPYTVWRTVSEECVKKVPYTTCRMEKCVVQKQVPYTTCKQVPYTVCVKVPYCVTECVPTTVCKKVKVCVPQDVCVKKCRLVRVQDDCCDSGHGHGFLRRLLHRCSPGCEPQCCEPSCCNGGGYQGPAKPPEPIPAPKPAEGAKPGDK
jgi:hypothetical protein